MTWFVGTSGWQYDSWKQPFYEGAPQREWLRIYAERFDTVEVNNAFYRLPQRSTFEKWAEGTPDGFVVAVKMSRYLTHIKRLKDPEEPVARFMDRVEGLGSKLGPVLLQLPPNLQADVDRLDQTLSLFPKSVRLTVEPRHETWWTNDVRRTLEKYSAALCLADRSGPITPLWRTADWGYIRFHHGRSGWGYGRKSLQTWAERLHELFGGDDVYAYFNNDPEAMAVRDAPIFRSFQKSNKSSR